VINKNKGTLFLILNADNPTNNVSQGPKFFGPGIPPPEGRGLSEPPESGVPEDPLPPIKWV
jgi:hypothetical protein